MAATRQAHFGFPSLCRAIVASRQRAATAPRPPKVTCGGVVFHNESDCCTTGYLDAPTHPHCALHLHP